jgi:polyhydroxyalkanoate synthase
MNDKPANGRSSQCSPPPRVQLERLHDVVEASIDPIGVAVPLAHAQMSWLMHPQELAEIFARLSSDLLAVQAHCWRRALGMASEDPIQPKPDDTRFADPAWQDQASFDIIKEWYLLLTHSVQDALYETPGLSGKERRRAAFWWRKWLNAMAPTNFFWSNPVALRKYVETNGESAVRGWHNFLADVQAGDVRMTNPSDFRVGDNLAATPGAVVHRNAIVEVIRYVPTTEKVHAVPVVIVMPWINKFYILDLNAKKSMVRYLLDQGFTVFITSWKNPGPELRDFTFGDYLTQGVDQIVRVARESCKADQVHAVGYCIGGTALAAYMAWAARAYDQPPVAHWTVFTTMVDFRSPGDIEVFLDEGSVRYLCRTMETRGFLDGKEMAAAFRLMRSNSLIWNYVVNGYLYGEQPPPFDVLYWNMDTTRMPYAMHSWYLRELYLKNRLVRKGALQVAGQPLDLERIEQPLYAVAAEDDHIAPWRQTFRINNLVMAPKRFVLSNSGHILGIVNPPVTPPKRKFWAETAHRADTFETWRERAPEQAGSWWPDWMAWLKPQSGPLIKPPPVATRKHPWLADAPGTYVLER